MIFNPCLPFDDTLPVLCGLDRRGTDTYGGKGATLWEMSQDFSDYLSDCNFELRYSCPGSFQAFDSVSVAILKKYAELISCRRVLSS